VDINTASIVQSVLSACILGVMGYYGKHIAESIHALKADLGTLKNSQRQQLKASIVRSYNEAESHGGVITATELETMHRRYESYTQLNGNSYVEALMRKADAEFHVAGELPEVVHHEAA
jgi:hypothetical protein